MQTIRRAVWAVALVAGSQNVSAEKLHTYWQLEPKSALPTEAAFDQPFLDLNVLPVHAVKTTSPSEFAALPEGTPLYLVFNDDGQVGYCPTPSDRQMSKAWLSGFATRRPCLVDSNLDGKFDKSFTVYDASGPGGVPSSHGSMRSAQPLSSEVSYVDTNVHDIWIPMLYRLAFSGPREPNKAKLELRTFREVASSRSINQGTYPIYVMLNYAIQMRPVHGDQADVAIVRNPELFVSSDDYNIYASRLPSWLQKYLDQRSSNVR